MPTFTPPTIAKVPQFLPDSTPIQKALYKFMPVGNAYVQVFLLSDGSIVQSDATAENGNTNVPYPWNPDNPSAPYAWGTYIDYEQTPPVQVAYADSLSVWILEYWDRPTEVDQETADYLSAKGYAAYITTP